jgi:hypothetical protein
MFIKWVDTHGKRPGSVLISPPGIRGKTGKRKKTRVGNHDS